MGEYFRSVSHGVLRWFYYRWGDMVSQDW